MWFQKSKNEDTVTPETADDEPVTKPSTKKDKRPLLIRLFAIKFWGAVRLTLLCVGVGLIQRVGQRTSEPEEVRMMDTIALIWENTFKGLIWAVQNGWQPALLGATIVLPIWILWRLVSLPFRK